MVGRLKVERFICQMVFFQNYLIRTIPFFQYSIFPIFHFSNITFFTFLPINRDHSSLITFHSKIVNRTSKILNLNNPQFTSHNARMHTHFGESSVMIQVLHSYHPCQVREKCETIICT